MWDFAVLVVVVVVVVVVVIFGLVVQGGIAVRIFRIFPRFFRIFSAFFPKILGWPPKYIDYFGGIWGIFFWVFGSHKWQKK
jgi:hypothetical protein